MTTNRGHDRDERPLERRPIFWFYGSASIAYGVKNNAFSYLLLIYANQVLGLPGVLASAALAIAMTWDALSDLLLGHWSDKTHSRLGRRHPFMYAAFLLLPVCFYALFNPVIDLDPSNTFAYVLITAILIRTGTTLFEVPSTALLPDLEKDYDRRNRWLALRHFFMWYGGNGIHTINFFFWIGAYGVTAQAGYSIYGTVGAFIIAMAILVSSMGTQQVAAAMPKPDDTFRFTEIGREIRQVFQSLGNRNFAALFSYGLAIGLAGGLGAALYLYNTTYYFGFSARQIATTGIFVLLAPLLAYWIAPRASLAFGKKNAAMASILVNIALHPIPYLLLLNGFWPPIGSWLSLGFYSIFVVLEVLFAIVAGVLMDSMLADVVEDSEVATERRSEGLFFAARGFALKAISAGGIVGAGSIVSAIGMDNVRSLEQMTDAIRLDLAVAFLPVYIALNLVGLWCVSRYQIDRSLHRANLDELANRAVESTRVGSPDTHA